ncbi:hypothetical protein D6810_00535 [Candidatus Dojkabacteria bacterium]|uniref:Purple acid phosphatase N-terminal domain-containing protein n=1 Tax=Candidatus Dojkabacteria bacterium TaxID=2099670 RepID=A0A3M0Z298_9BACT|nr:MAG: hypothetical protein D6810_00535 [Candidatus Dojkabacteria bacterium]
MDEKRIEVIKTVSKVSLVVFLIFLIGYVVLYLISFIFDDGGGIRDVEITNVSSNSFTVVWVTDRPVLSEVLVSESENFLDLVPRWTSGAKNYFDERDVSQENDGRYVYKQNKARTHHFVTIRDLDPEREYYFRILGGLKAFKIDDKFKVKTFKETESTQTPFPVMSRAINSEDESVFLQDAFVVVTVYKENTIGQKIATFVNNNNGGWTFDLRNVRKEDGELMDWGVEPDILADVYFRYADKNKVSRNLLKLNPTGVLENIFYNFDVGN